MNRRRFGRDGTVSAVGFGCMSFGGFYGPTNESETMRALARALELGVDFWDTANVYGEGVSETMIGKFLAEDISRRPRITLATKFAIRREPDGRRVFDNSPEHIRDSLEGSLRRLGVDWIDLYYVHRIDRRIPIEDTVGELARHVKAGTIRAIGLSEVAPDTLRRASAVHPIAAVQSEYSLDAQSRARARSGLRRGRGDHGRVLAGRRRLFQRPPPGGRDVRREGFPSWQPALLGARLAAQPRPPAALSGARPIVGREPRDARRRLDAGQGAAHRADPGHPYRRTSRAMRRRRRFCARCRPARRTRASPAGRLRRRRTLLGPAMGRHPEVLSLSVAGTPSARAPV